MIIGAVHDVRVGDPGLRVSNKKSVELNEDLIERLEYIKGFLFLLENTELFGQELQVALQHITSIEDSVLKNYIH